MTNHRHDTAYGLMSDLSFAAMWWHIISDYGDGDCWEGRERLIREGWVDGAVLSDIARPRVPAAVRYANKHYPKGFVATLESLEKNRGPTVTESIHYLFSAGNGMSLMWYLLMFWYDKGLPSVQVGHKLASNLMLTNVAESVLEDIKLPFDAFTIEVPNKLLYGSVAGNREDLRTVLVSYHMTSTMEKGVAYVAVGAGELNMWSLQPTTKELLGEGHLELNEDAGPMDYALEKEDERTVAMLKRLIAGVCLYMTNGGETKTVGKGHKWTGHKRDPGPPTKRIYKLTTPVQHNFTDVVRDYVDGTGKKITVQSVVTGHWKSQPHGPGRKERKRIFVSPYWRGPEDAPIAKRAHKL